MKNKPTATKTVAPAAARNAKAKRPTKRASKKQSAPTTLKPSPNAPHAKTPKSPLSSTPKSWEAKPDEMEGLIAENPKNAFRVALGALDNSLEVIWRLIENKSLPSPIPPGLTVGLFPLDRASNSIADRFTGMVEKISRHALAGNDTMIATAWYMAMALTEAVHDIALSRPDRLESLTKTSLFMPSLRARQKNFDYDFAAIADRTHLSEECPFNASASALHRLNTPATRLMANVLDHIARSITFRKNLRATLTLPFQDADSRIAGVREFAELYIDKLIIGIYEDKDHELQYDKLPPLTKKTVKHWWDNAVKSEVEQRFERIKGTAFHTELQKATASGKDYQVKDEMKRRCHQALKSLARPDPKD